MKRKQNQQLDDNDHRVIARRMDLLHFQEEAPGMVFFHPRGHIIHRELIAAARRHLEGQGYREVRSPQLLRRPIWEASGHWQHFGEAMFQFEEKPGCESAIKPVSCPGHIQIAEHHLQSYRDLPLRLAEFGLVHRDERSGSLHGLLRLRQFVQDDGHIFCRQDDAVEEIERFCAGMKSMYRGFGLEACPIALSLRPESSLGDASRWEEAEAVLREGARRAGLDFEEKPGEGAFYGPKLEWQLEDHAGRLWQAGVIQVDLFMPQRFGLSYVDEHDDQRHPVMLHRAVYGCPERFMGLLLEQHEGRLPAWLAPEQAVVLPISGGEHGYARQVADALKGRDVRVKVDASSESLGRRIAAAHERGVPCMLIVGPREAEAASVAVRLAGDGDQRQMSLARAVDWVAEAARPPI